MKSFLLLAAGGALLLSACAPMKKPASKPTAQPQTTQQANAYTGQYTAQPGQPVAAPHNSVTDAAFNQAVTGAPVVPAQPQTYTPQAYLPQQPAQQPVYSVDPVTGQFVPVQPAQQALYTVDPVTGQFVPVQAAAPAPQVPAAPTYDQIGQQQPGLGTIGGVSATPGMGLPAEQPMQPQQPVAAGSANYAVQMINGTTGRLFVEVFDDSDNVFPVGYMFAGQNISTPPSEPRAIQGQLTVVIRDPDTPDARELRRYKVTPPANYTNKTIGITILPGGRYRASLDGQVYFTSPDPKAATPEGAAAPAATPAAAPAPAAPAPAPAQPAAPAPAPAADPATAPTQIL